MTDESPQVPDLSFATFDELRNELEKRCDAFVLGAILKAKTPDAVTIQFFGPRLLGRGLLADMADRATYLSHSDATGDVGEEE
jgi:hypothetical protein